MDRSNGARDAYSRYFWDLLPWMGLLLIGAGSSWWYLKPKAVHQPLPVHVASSTHIPYVLLPEEEKALKSAVPEPAFDVHRIIADSPAVLRALMPKSKASTSVRVVRIPSLNEASPHVVAVLYAPKDLPIHFQYPKPAVLIPHVFSGWQPGSWALQQKFPARVVLPRAPFKTRWVKLNNGSVPEAVAVLPSVPSAGNKTGPVYYLQLGAFSSAQYASVFANEIGSWHLGAPAAVESDSGPKHWMRVVVGPFRNKSDVQRAQALLNARDQEAMVLEETG